MSATEDQRLTEAKKRLLWREIWVHIVVVAMIVAFVAWIWSFKHSAHLMEDT
jgi:hypothetical protein